MNSSFFYDHDVDTKLKLTSYFLYTYQTNHYSMIFAPFPGVNHHDQSVTLGCGLLSNEIKTLPLEMVRSNCMVIQKVVRSNVQQTTNSDNYRSRPCHWRCYFRRIPPNSSLFCSHLSLSLSLSFTSRPSFFRFPQTHFCSILACLSFVHLSSLIFQKYSPKLINVPFSLVSLSSTSLISYFSILLFIPSLIFL